MTADPTFGRAAHAQLVVDVDRSGDMDPAEADRILRECLSLVDKRLAAALRPALADLQAAMPLDQNVDAPPRATFDNPFSADYVCDAFGNVCRELWPEDGLWRPIMERLVRATTEPLAALHRDLNALLQDRDVLPTMRVRTRARGGAQQP